MSLRCLGEGKPEGFEIILRYRWLVLGAAWFSYFQASFHRVAPAPILPTVTAELGISNALAGSLISAYFLSYVLLQIPAGQAVDRYGPRPVIGPAILLLSLAALWFAFISSYAEGFAARILIGVASGFIYVPAMRTVISWFPVTERGRGIGLYTSGGVTGATIALASMPVLTLGFGWRTGYALTTAMPFVATVVAALVLKSTATDSAKPTINSDPDVRSGGRPSLSAVFRNPYVVMSGVINFTVFGSLIGLSTWTYSYAVRELGVEPVVAGLLPSAISLGAGVAQVLIGFVSDRLGRRKPFLVGGIVSASVCVALFGLTRSVPLAFVLAFLAGASVGVGVVMIFSIVSEQVEREQIGSAAALTNMMASVGPVVTPYVGGILLDVTGSFQNIFLFLSALLVIGSPLSLLEKEGMRPSSI